MKDADRGTREISLKPGSHGVLLTLSGDRAIRRSADGRGPITTGTHYSAVAVHQVRASAAGSGEKPPRAAPGEPLLKAEEITILTGWPRAWQKHSPTRLSAPGIGSPTQARVRRGAMISSSPSSRHRSPKRSRAISQTLAAATAAGGGPSFDAMLISAQEVRPDELPLERLPRRVLRSTLEQLRTRQRITAADHD
jgi:hypothetical protein